MKAVSSRTGLSRRVPFPKKKSVSSVPQLVVEMQLRTTPGCQRLWGKRGGHSGCVGESPTLWRPWGQPQDDRVLWLDSVFSFSLFSFCASYHTTGMISSTAVRSLLWALSVEKAGRLGSGGNITKKGRKKNPFIWPNLAPNIFNHFQN